MKNRSIIVTAAVIVAAFIASGCSGAKKADSAGTGEGRYRLKVAWFPATIKASLTSVAYAKGFFAEEGLEVEPVVLQNNADATTALTLGKVDVLPVGITLQLQFISENSNLVIFGGSAMEGGVIVTLPSRAGEFTNWNNWRGKNWGTGRSYTGDFVVRDHLRKLNIVPDRDITISDINTDNAIVQAVAKGTVDVGYITSDGVAIAEQMGLVVILKVADLDPGYPCCRQTTSVEAVAAKRDALVAYQRGLIRAYRLIQSDPGAVIDVMTELSGQSRQFVETGIYGEYASRYIPSPALQKVVKFNEYLRQEGVVKNLSVDIADRVDTSIFAEALGELLRREPDDPHFLELKAFTEEYDRRT